MSKESKKTVKAKATASKQTSMRHTTVPTAPAEATITRPAPAVSVAVPVVAHVVTPVEIAPAKAAATVAETGVAVATRAPVEAAPAVDREIVAGLLRDLRHEDADAAREAAIALGATGSPAAVEALIGVLANADGFYHSVVRAAAASSLARLGDKRAVASLLDAVNDTMAEASAEAVRALADLGDARAVATLIGVVRNDSGFFQPVVRLAAVHALGRFDTPQAAAERARVAADTSENTVIRDAAGV